MSTEDSNMGTEAPHTSISTLPLEVLGLVVDSFTYERTRAKMRDLQSLALVCKDFLPFCRSQIFRRIDNIGFFGWDTGEPRLRLIRLGTALKRNPALLPLVRELTFHIDLATPDCLMPSTYLEQFSNMLFKFPNLTHLTYSNVSQPSLVWRERPHTYNTFPQELVEHYLSQKTLRCLSIKQFPHHNFDYRGIFQCDTLEDFCITGMRVSAFSLPGISSNIRRLSVTSTTSFPLSTLVHLPHLEALSLQEVQMAPQVTSIHELTGTVSPTMMLTILSLNLVARDDLAKFLIYYRAHGQKTGLKPFAALRKLSVHLRHKDEVDVLQPLLEDLKELKSLRLFSTKIPIPLLSFRLDHHIRNTFPGLNNLLLSLNASLYDNLEFDTVTMTDIHSIFTANASTSKLENLRLSIESGVFNHPTPPSSEPWAFLGQLLACPATFPDLKRVRITFSLDADRDTFYYLRSEHGKKCFSTLICDAMPLLQESLGDNFKGVFNLRCSSYGFDDFP
ncbi:hypothetical protein BJ165DRAFT_1529294 [Panaeolus papilionaceus]|nr:hypothetical protein BJ165DRAFT_1529294 [Panaeolus papilionaceus]